MTAAPELKPVVVTRAEESDGPLSRELKSLGLPVLVWAAVRVLPADTAQLEEALSRAESFDWIVFTSRHAVAAVLARLPAPPPRLRTAAVGRATASVLQQHGWAIDLLPGEPSAAGVVAAFAEAGTARGARILYPASSRALPTLAAGLRQLGAQVSTVEAYRTVSGNTLDVEDCRSWIQRQGVGAITFASPSAVAELESALGQEDFARLLGAAPAVAIGPTTARALTERGYTPTLAESATLRGLARTSLHAVSAGPAVHRPRGRRT
ncbi:MAG: uroporphyrinogen-III synthase [Gammaproteobacteria bacterium]|nr:uroporphyrinogen-III synthase [Gammaproteobacteria bacterium]MDE2261110.1 uroporphyrinogen-III synthase [Gammaproteobacteria bacterium]